MPNDTILFIVMTLVTGFSGCTSGHAFDLEEPETAGSRGAPIGLEAGLWSATETGWLGVDSLPGLTIEGTTYAWSPLHTLEKDSLDLIMLRATANTTYELSISDSIYFDRVPDGNAPIGPTLCGGQVYGGLMGLAHETPLDGQFYLDRAAGLAATQPSAIPTLSVGFGKLGAGPHVGGGGWSSHGTGDNGTLEAGDWFLLGAGISGFNAQQTAAGSHISYEFAAEEPMQAFDLASTGLVCGIGFSNLHNATVSASYGSDLQLGGEREIDTRYGSSFFWKDICWPADAANPANSARVTIDGEEHSVDTTTLALNVWSYGQGTGGISVEFWKGGPSWILMGLAVSEDLRTPPVHPGCLRP